MPFMSTLGAFNPMDKGGQQAVLSSNYVRYVTTGSPQYYVTNVGGGSSASAEDKTVDTDSVGNMYVVLTTTPGTPSRTFIIEKYLANRHLGACKSITLPSAGDIIQSINILVDKVTNIPYIAICSLSSGVNVRTTLIALDNNLNVTWSKTYSRANSGGTKVYMAKAAGGSYIYVTQGVGAIFIFTDSGVLLNTYDGVDIELPLIPFSLGTGGAFFVRGTLLGSGRSYVTLSSGLTSILSAKKGTTATANTIVNASTFNSTDGYIYAVYFNSGTGKSGVYKNNFNNSATSVYQYTFSEPNPLQFTGITTDGTYLYVTAIDYNTADNNNYMLKFDTSMNYVDGYKLSSTTVTIGGPAYIPTYYDNETYACSEGQIWALPSDMSTPGTGTYVINGATWVKSSITSPTRSAGSLGFTPTSPAITTITPTLVSQTLTSVSVTDKLIFVGI